MDANKPNENPQNDEQNELNDFNIDDLGDLDDLSGSSPVPVNNDAQNDDFDDMIVVEESSDNVNIDANIDADEAEEVGASEPTAPIDPSLVNEEIPIHADETPLVTTDSLSDDLGGDLSEENSELVDSIPAPLDNMLASAASSMEEALDLDAPDSPAPDSVEAVAPAVAQVAKPAPVATPAPTPAPASKPAKPAKTEETAQKPTPQVEKAEEVAEETPKPVAKSTTKLATKPAPAKETVATLEEADSVAEETTEVVPEVAKKVTKEKDLNSIDDVIDELSAPLEDDIDDSGKNDVKSKKASNVKSSNEKSSNEKLDKKANKADNKVADEDGETDETDEVAEFEKDVAVATGEEILSGVANSSDDDKNSKDNSKKASKTSKLFGFMSRKKKNDDIDDNDDNDDNDKLDKNNKSAKQTNNKNNGKNVNKNIGKNKDQKVAFKPTEQVKPQGNIFVRFLHGIGHAFAHSFDGAIDLFATKPLSVLLLFIGVVPFWLPILSGIRGYINSSGGFAIGNYEFSPVFCGLLASLMILLVRGYFASTTLDSRYFPIRYAVGLGRLLLNYVLTGLLIFMFIFFAFWVLMFLFKIWWVYGLVSLILVFAVFYYTRALLAHPLSKPLFIDILLSLLWLAFTASSTYGVQLFFVAFAVNLIVMWANGYFDALKDDSNNDGTDNTDDNNTNYKNEKSEYDDIEELSEIDEVLEEHGKNGHATR